MTILFLGVGLAMDAVALSFAIASIIKSQDFNRLMLKCAITFGVFQGLLFGAGLILGNVFSIYFVKVLAYISFSLLLFVSLKLFYEYFKGEEEFIQEINNKSIIVIGFVTAIDALVSGVASTYFDFNVVYAIFGIGMTTLVLSFFAFIIAKRFKKIKFLEKNSLLIGAIILMYLAIKVVI